MPPVPRRQTILSILMLAFALGIMWFVVELWKRREITERMLNDWVDSLPDGPLSKEQVLAAGLEGVDERWHTQGGISDAFGRPIRIEVTHTNVRLTSAGFDGIFGTWDDHWSLTQIIYYGGQP